MFSGVLAMPWAKGKSGNPGGRPKNKPLTTELDRLLRAKAFNSKTSHLAMVVSSLVERAETGDMAAQRIIWEYLEGKPVQAVSGPDGGGFEFTIQIAGRDGSSDDAPPD